MDRNTLMISAVRNMAVTISAILGTPVCDTALTINGKTVFADKV